jgi:hypothetical protein
MGLESMNDAAKTDEGNVLQGQDPMMFTDTATVLRSLASLPPSNNPRVLLWWGADGAWGDATLAANMLLLRDRLTQRGVQLIGLGATGIRGPLTTHVHPLTDDMPDDKQRATLIKTFLDGQKDVPKYDADTLRSTVNATRGLHSFAVEQIAALASDAGKLDPKVASKRWRAMLAQLPGIRVLNPWPLEWYGGNRAWLAEIMGYKQAGVSLVCVLDELEKVVGRPGQARDSGASDAITGGVLDYLNGSDEHEVCGAIAEGVPGMGKTMSAQIAASVLGCPALLLNPTQMKGGIVGETERNLATVLGALRSFGGLQLWIGTSNNLSTVPEELCDRFPSGVHFFDLPTYEERVQIWRGQMGRYGFDADNAEAMATFPGFTGRDVRACCLEAKRKRADIVDVAQARIPGAVKMRKRIDAMRRDAQSEGYKSASTGAAYNGPVKDDVATGPRQVRRQAPKAPPAPAPKPEPTPEPKRRVRQAPKPSTEMF